YDWSHYDPIFAGAARNGIRVLVTVYSSPVWAEPSAETPPLGAALPGFQAFVSAAVSRYGSGGRLWSGPKDRPNLPVTQWQLWNEPNSPLFWKPAPDPVQYAELLRAFHSTISGVDPSAQVIAGGLFPTPAAGIPIQQFVTSLYRLGASADFDAVAVH